MFWNAVELLGVAAQWQRISSHPNASLPEERVHEVQYVERRAHIKLEESPSTRVHGLVDVMLITKQGAPVSKWESRDSTIML
ncbi:hypothetical protein Bca101_079892 [Brassica carinata]